MRSRRPRSILGRPRPPPRFPSPKGPEAHTMPTQDRLGLNHLSRAKKARPESNQPNHKRPIAAAQSETRRRPPHCDIELMTQKQSLGFKPHTRPEYVGDEPSKQLQDRDHCPQHCDDSALQRESSTGWNFRKGQDISTVQSPTSALPPKKQTFSDARTRSVSRPPQFDQIKLIGLTVRRRLCS
jgi:hypothetical protein